MTLIETELNRLLAENRQLKQENAELKTAIHEMRIANAATERAFVLHDSMLSIESIARLNEAFKDSTDNSGLKQAINAERRHVRGMSKQDHRVERILGGAR